MDIIYRIYQTAKQPAVAMDLKFDYFFSFGTGRSLYIMAPARIRAMPLMVFPCFVRLFLWLWWSNLCILASLSCAGQTYHCQVISGNLFGGMVHPVGNPPLNSFYKTPHQIVLHKSLRDFRGVRILISREHFRKIFPEIPDKQSAALRCEDPDDIFYKAFIICESLYKNTPLSD